MKKSTKLMASAIAAAAIFFGTTQVKAQSKDNSPWRFGIGLEAGAPTGNAHNFSNFELGGTARLQYGADKGLAWTLTSGYYNMFGKEFGNTGVKYNSLGIVPLKVGLKAFFADNVYFSAEGGPGFETNSGGSTKLILSPGLGYANTHWDVGVRYENFSGQSNNYGLVGARIAYGFGL
ncbi:hypothetical protein HQ865_14420 [Mucilaginibacter mali]|uniref:Outer membrane protein beta-barrel domain-containing protein n=1 Tax=Mucilaginibacter mali TaxID=2740462 RepID=A0A7D4TNF0_9SPHI|nr:hypothetical protein [Mucilaginibacter mali]QKJ30893.1 hypothetical protein HQ865_14420 [Mucilaginibacter mali]